MIDAEDIARVRAPLERAWTLPPAAYTDPAIWALERRAIFERDWLCVARVDQLPEPGDFRCVDLHGQPVVLVRDQTETLRALSSVCLHRAMPVVEGQGNANRLTCPYHHWTYELDGRLRSAPMMDDLENFDPGQCRLPALELEVWQGFVFVNLDPNAAPLGPQLEGLAGYLEGYDFGDLVIAASTEYPSPWNWKILVENFMEAYHHIGPHSRTFEPNYPARESSVPDNGGAPWTCLHMPRKPGTEEAGPPLFPKLAGAARHQLLAMNVYPTLLFAASSQGGVWYQLEPRAHDDMHLTIHFLLPREIDALLGDEERRAIIDQVRVVHDEDIGVNEGPWRGLKAPMTTQGRLSTFEKAIWQLNQLWLDRMAPLLGD